MFGWDAVEKQHVIDILLALKDFFSDKERWTDFPPAEDKNGVVVDPSSDQAVRWSLMGAGEKLGVPLFGLPLANYVECATRELLDDLTDGKHAHGMSYDDEYALICLAIEDLTKEQ
jgi:hypothetical protein